MTKAFNIQHFAKIYFAKKKKKLWFFSWNKSKDQEKTLQRKKYYLLQAFGPGYEVEWLVPWESEVFYMKEGNSMISHAPQQVQQWQLGNTHTNM